MIEKRSVPHFISNTSDLSKFSAFSLSLEHNVKALSRFFVHGVPQIVSYNLYLLKLCLQHATVSSMAIKSLKAVCKRVR